jgi:hypothetical protein
MELSDTHGWRWPHKMKIMVMCGLVMMIKLRDFEKKKEKTK